MRIREGPQELFFFHFFNSLKKASPIFIRVREKHAKSFFEYAVTIRERTMVTMTCFLFFCHSHFYRCTRHYFRGLQPGSRTCFPAAWEIASLCSTSFNLSDSILSLARKSFLRFQEGPQELFFSIFFVFAKAKLPLIDRSPGNTHKVLRLMCVNDMRENLGV